MKKEVEDKDLDLEELKILLEGMICRDPERRLKI